MSPSGLELERVIRDILTEDCFAVARLHFSIHREMVAENQIGTSALAQFFGAEIVGVAATASVTELFALARSGIVEPAEQVSSAQSRFFGQITRAHCNQMLRLTLTIIIYNYSNLPVPTKILDHLHLDRRWKDSTILSTR